jgi:hypothetical protein
LVPGACANDAWLDLLQCIVSSGAESRPRGLLIKELLCKTTVVDMREPIVTVKARKLGYCFMAVEAWMIITGRNDVASIKPYSPHIASFSDDGYRFDGAYGPRVVDQLRYVVDALSRDPDSRQAVIEIWRPNPRDSRDVPCTLTVQWMIRDGKLHCLDSMRSSDAWLGWPYDVFNFSMLSLYILLMLRERHDLIQHPHVRLSNLQLGDLYLTAGSSHLYVDPKVDGATNIPYYIKDVEALVMSDANTTKYNPLRIEEFKSPNLLVEHLNSCKQRICTLDWMRELYQ